MFMILAVKKKGQIAYLTLVLNSMLILVFNQCASGRRNFIFTGFCVYKFVKK